MTHVPRWMPGSLILSGGENVFGIPSACATRNFRILVKGPWPCLRILWQWQYKHIKQKKLFDNIHRECSRPVIPQELLNYPMLSISYMIPQVITHVSVFLIVSLPWTYSINVWKSMTVSSLIDCTKLMSTHFFHELKQRNICTLLSIIPFIT